MVLGETVDTTTFLAIHLQIQTYQTTSVKSPIKELSLLYTNLLVQHLRAGMVNVNWKGERKACSHRLLLPASHHLPELCPTTLSL